MEKEKYSLYCQFCDQRDSGLRCNECVTIYLPNGKYYPSNFTLDPDVVASSALLSRLYDDKSEDKMVSHPDHYQTKTGLETIQVIEAFTDGLEGIEAVCTANVIKYICRWKKKNGLQDLKKAQWYLTYLVNHLEKPGEDQKVEWTIKEDGLYLNGRKLDDIVNEALNKIKKENK